MCVTPLYMHKERLVRIWEICPAENVRQELLAAIHEVDQIAAEQLTEDQEHADEVMALLRRT